MRQDAVPSRFLLEQRERSPDLDDNGQWRTEASVEVTEMTRWGLLLVREGQEQEW